MYTIESIINDAKAGASIERIYKRYGGISIYIPKVSPQAHKSIKEEFNGHNYDSLAHKYNLSSRTIREIVKKEQKGLFD